MRWQRIAGNTYIIDSPAITIGVYVFGDKSCLLIDSGAGNKFAGEIIKTLEEKDLKIYGIFNTHSHADHCGGNNYIQSLTECNIYASALEKPFIENPILIPFCQYSAHPVKALRNKFLMARPSRITHVVNPGAELINGTEFSVLPLSGHSSGQVGIITPDRISFIGDALISKNNLKMFPFLYMADLQAHFQTLDMLAGSSSDNVFLSHGGRINDILELSNANKKVIDGLLQRLITLIKVPQGREELVQNIVEMLGIHVSRTQYFLILSSISAYLTYLCDSKQARINIKDGLLRFSSR